MSNRVAAAEFDPSKRADDTADVIVIGLGAAGASAAIEARSAGADVLVLERASNGGGSTAYSGGYVYLGGGTRLQKKNGFDDTPTDMYNYLMAVTPQPDATKIRDYCDHSVAHFEWIEAQGLKFLDGYDGSKHFEHMSGNGLTWSGNEKAWPYRDKARPMPRGHKVTRPEGLQKLGEGGYLLAETLIRSATAAGARITPNARVTQLILEQGRVVGVHYRQFGEDRVAYARRGVVIATGGFGANKDMLQEFCPFLADERMNIVGAPTADGSGIQLGLSAGAVMENSDGSLVTSPFYPPASLLKGILVNKLGQRFVTEDAYHGKSSTACLDQPDRVAWLICDNAIYGEPEFKAQPLVDAWESVAEMERDLGIPTGALQKTLAEYNANAASGHDPQFHKHADWLQPLVEPPFAALDCSFGKAFYSGFTLGGLKTSVSAEVLDGQGRPVPGLFAAGACASNIAQDGAGYSSGTCLGESTYFGRRAGASAAGLPSRRSGTG